MAEFDIISKELFKDYPTDFLHFVLGQEPVELLEIIDPQLPTVESREMDILARVRIRDEEAFVHIEFQTSDSTRVPMPRRMAGYIGRSIESFGLPICAFVIYLRPDAGRNDPGRYDQERLGFRFLIEYRVIRLIELEGQAVIDRKLWGLLPFAPLMQPPVGTPSEDWLRQCVQATNEIRFSQREKLDFLTDLAILSGLIYNYTTITNIISEETMFESVVAQKLAERGLAQGLEQGRQQGLEQGRQQGRQQGLQQGRILSILDLINERFGSTGVAQTKPVLEPIEDLDILRRLLVKASQTQTFEEFRQALNALTSESVNR